MYPSPIHRLAWNRLVQSGVWMWLVTPVALLAGTISAAFLWALEEVTRLRFEHPWLLFLLPLGGPVIVWLYRYGGRGAERGTNLILEEIHQPGGGVPFRMAPLILLTTLLSHLLGGSVGREGTAVQMGGALAGGWADWFGIAPENRQTLLLGGVAAGFGAVFGTPLAGAVFALEVLTRGRLFSDILLPCLWAGILGDWTCTVWGIHHTSYTIATMAQPDAWVLGHWNVLLIGKSLLAGGCFGLVAWLFIEASHGIQRLQSRWIRWDWLRPMIGGGTVILLTLAIGTRSYLGIGVSSPDPKAVTLVSCFQSGGATSWSWIWKLIFTAVTVGSGFKGGEVTPLFFMGAALGNALSGPMAVPPDWLAGLGFVSVFAGASNTPIACTLMGIELFGSEHTVPLACACATACWLSGPGCIYSGQRPVG